MMTKHTKGPWNYRETGTWPETNHHLGIYADDASMPQVAKVEGMGYISEANARLIAAAPELLTELKRLASAYVSLMETGRDRIIALGGQCDPVDVMEAGNPWLRAAKEAIAKAEGL